MVKDLIQRYPFRYCDHLALRRIVLLIFWGELHINNHSTITISNLTHIFYSSSIIFWFATSCEYLASFSSPSYYASSCIARTPSQNHPSLPFQNQFYHSIQIVRHPHFWSNIFLKDQLPIQARCQMQMEHHLCDLPQHGITYVWYHCVWFLSSKPLHGVCKHY